MNNNMSNNENGDNMNKNNFLIKIPTLKNNNNNQETNDQESNMDNLSTNNNKNTSPKSPPTKISTKISSPPTEYKISIPNIPNTNNVDENNNNSVNNNSHNEELNNIEGKSPTPNRNRSINIKPLNNNIKDQNENISPSNTPKNENIKVNNNNGNNNMNMMMVSPMNSSKESPKDEKKGESLGDLMNSPNTSMKMNLKQIYEDDTPKRKKQYTLEQVFKQLSEKEESLVSTLDEIISQFRDPIEGEEILNEDEIDNVFGNLEEFLSFHKAFRVHLLISLKESKSKKNDVEVVQKFVEFFDKKQDIPFNRYKKTITEVYEAYFETRRESHEVITKLLKTNKEFINFVDQVKSKTGNKIENLMNIPLLYWHSQMKAFKDLVSFVFPYESCPGLLKSFVICSSIAKIGFDLNTKIENSTIFHNTIGSFDVSELGQDSGKNSFDNISVDDTPKYIRQGHISWETKPYFAFLFSDRIVLCKSKILNKKNPYVAKNVIVFAKMLRGVRIDRKKAAIRIETQKGAFYLKSETDQSLWFSDLKFLEEKIKYKTFGATVTELTKKKQANIPVFLASVLKFLTSNEKVKGDIDYWLTENPQLNNMKEISKFVEKQDPSVPFYTVTETDMIRSLEIFLEKIPGYLIPSSASEKLLNNKSLSQPEEIMQFLNDIPKENLDSFIYLIQNLTKLSENTERGDCKLLVACVFGPVVFAPPSKNVENENLGWKFAQLFYFFMIQYSNGSLFSEDVVPLIFYSFEDNRAVSLKKYEPSAFKPIIVRIGKGKSNIDVSGKQSINVETPTKQVNEVNVDTPTKFMANELNLNPKQYGEDPLEKAMNDSVKNMDSNVVVQTQSESAPQLDNNIPSQEVLRRKNEWVKSQKNEQALSSENLHSLVKKEEVHDTPNNSSTDIKVPIMGTKKIQKDSPSNSSIITSPVPERNMRSSLKSSSLLESEEEDEEERILFTTEIDPNDKQPKKVVKGGSIDALIVELTHPDYISTDLQDTLLFTYVTFISPKKFLNNLIERFWHAPSHKNAESIQLRVLNFMKTWIEMDTNFDSNFELRKTLFSFIEQTKTDNRYTLLSEGLERSFKRKEKFSKSNLEYPVSFVPEKMGCSYQDFISWNPIEIARQFSLIEFELFSKINPIECVYYIKAETKYKANNIVQFIKRFNHVSKWVSTLVLQQSDIKERVNVIIHFIKIAKAAYDIKNLLLVFEITSGLQNTPIFRLKQTWENLPYKWTQEFKTMSSFISPENNYRAYRTFLDQNTPPCVPFVGVWLQDITFINDGNKDFLNDQETIINIIKRRLLAKIISQFHQYQRLDFLYKKVPTIFDYLESITCLTDRELTDLSIKLEQKGAKTKKNFSKSFRNLVSLKN